jgi:uncharacterized protein (DUF1778 family)
MKEEQLRREILTVWLTEAEKKALSQACELLSVNYSTFVRQAIKEKLEK